MNAERGIFVISLDLELYWGLRDVMPLAHYRENLLGERKVIPLLLCLFSDYGIHATWATVGFLFFETHRELMAHLPTERPTYDDLHLSPYTHVRDIGDSENSDPFHYGASLVRAIACCPHQEIATHTFSHYYCLENGQSKSQFTADLVSAVEAAAKYNVQIESIVFPRNQVNSDYLAACAEAGIRAFRGNPQHWLYESRTKHDETLFRRAMRLVDCYVNISGDNTYGLNSGNKEYPINLRQSRFLYPYSRKRRFLDHLRLRRILSSLTVAATRQRMYHLWWHPHNFGININENLSMLQKILDHYHRMRDQYGMESLNMREVARRVVGQNAGREEKNVGA